MKTRFGFVSNSSSSSFVVAVDDIKNMGEFALLVNKHNETYDEGYIFIGKRFVHGELDMHDTNIIKYLKKNKIYYEEES